MGSKLGISNIDNDDLMDEDEGSDMDQRATLIENYGVTMEFPAFYYYNAKFVPHEKDHLVTMEFHIIPQNEKTTVQTTFQNGNVEENLFSEIYDQTGENIILTLYKQTERNGLVC